MRFIFSLHILLLFFSLSAQAAVNPLTLKQWSNEEKYVSASAKTIPLLNQSYFAFTGLNIGFKNGTGVDVLACKKINRYLCGGARLFVGSLNSQALVRAPLATDVTLPKTTEYYSLLAAPQTWFSLVPELGFAVTTQIIPLNDGRWSESAWFGMGRAMLGGHSGWSFSFEEGINHRFENARSFGWTARAKYTFGWLYSKDQIGTIPFDWFNLTAGIFYVW